MNHSQESFGIRSRAGPMNDASEPHVFSTTQTMCAGMSNGSMSTDWHFETFAGRYSASLDVLVINEWVFEARRGEPDFVCGRSSGPSDYHAEWWFLPSANKFRLLWVAYHESGVTPKADGTVWAEVETYFEVLKYCCTHIHALQ